MPKVSVVMPAYNAEKYIQEAIESILNQTYTDFEFIIINDGSTDRTKEIIQSYKDSRIRYLENVHNSGIVTTLNKGLDYATGEYIARMDADDIAMKDRLKEQNRFLDRHDEIGVVGSAMIVFNEKGEENLFPYSTTPGRAKAELMFNSSLGHPTVMIRKRCLENIRYEAEYQGLEDFVMWWRIAQRYQIVSLKKPLLKYRKHTDQVTKNRSKEFYDRFNVFTLERIHVLLDSPPNSGISVFQKYCIGDDNISREELNELITFLSDMSRANSIKKIFNQHELETVFGLAVSYVTGIVLTDDVTRRNAYALAWGKKALNTELYLKLLWHSYRRSKK